MNMNIKDGVLYPFVQLQAECKMSIFHPAVYPLYRMPIDKDEESIMNGTMRKSAITHQNSAGLGATVSGYLKYGIQFLLGGEEAKQDD